MSIEEIYGKIASVDNIQRKQIGLWKDIVSVEAENKAYSQIFQQNMNLIIGKGNTVRFWEDCWCASENLARIYPRFYSTSNQQSHMIADIGIWMVSCGNGISLGEGNYTRGKAAWWMN